MADERAVATVTVPLKRIAVAIAAIALFAVDGAGAPATPSTPAPRSNDIITREVWKVPLPGQRLRMVTTVLRPPGDGPFPLAVVNHGSTENSYARAHEPLPLYPLISRWLLARGFIVALPLRPGHGATGGPYFEDEGRCDNANYLRSGLRTADSIQAAIAALTAKPYVRKTGVVVIGQSAGAWGALALASRNPRNVGAVIDFAGGRGGHADGKPNHNCVPDRLVQAAGVYGRTARIPTLWLYAENDSYFAPSLSERMAAAFKKAGGRADYHLLPAIGHDGHPIMQMPAASKLWSPIVAAFLKQHP